MPHTLQQNNTAAISLLRTRLQAMADPEYAAFQSALLRKPGESELTGSAAHYLGVRLPKLRKLSGELAKESWRENLEVLKEANRAAEPSDSRYEELMLEGMLIGLAAGQPVTIKEQLALTADFVPLIDNWGVCDSFCAGLKIAESCTEQFWDFLQPYFTSDKEYHIRFGLVMLLNYFIKEEYLDRIWPVIDAIQHEGYYVKMAQAWAISICYVKFPEKTLGYLKNCGLDLFTYNKALQKITESRCVSVQEKEMIRKLRKKAAKQEANNR